MPRWLDRLWLVLIALAFAIAAPIWFILSIERMGWRFVVASVAVALISRLTPR